MGVKEIRGIEGESGRILLEKSISLRTPFKDCANGMMNLEDERKKDEN